MKKRLLIEIEYDADHHVGGMLDDVCKTIFSLQDALKPGLAHRVPLLWGGSIYGSVRFAAHPATVATHLGRGTNYSALETAIAQCGAPILDDEIVQVYRDRDDGKLFIRPVPEFRDGRFKIEGDIL